VILLTKLHKRYGRFTAVESLDLEVKDGEIFGSSVRMAPARLRPFA